MTDAAGPPEIDAPTAAAWRDARTAWLWGGGLLVAAAAAGLAAPFLAPGSIVVFWLRTLSFSAALVIFALGVRGSGSIVDRRPLGVVALIVLAAWPLADQLVYVASPSTMDNVTFYMVWGNVSLAVSLAAAIVSVVVIARVGAVPHRWRWAPLWALAAACAPQVILMVVASTPGSQSRDILGAMFGLGQLIYVAVPLCLGILAIVFAQRPPVAAAAPAVQVYPPAV